jgi:hypothetical protein
VTEHGPADRGGEAPPASSSWMAPGLLAVGSALTVLSGSFTWLDIAGDSLSGFRIADLLLAVGGKYPETPPRWFGAVWYLVPLCAAACWVVLFVTWPIRVRPLHLVLVAVPSFVVVLITASTATSTIIDGGGGLTLAAVGQLFCWCAIVIGFWRADVV